MKVRVISSLVGLVILGVVLFFLDTLLLNAVIGLISIMAVFEVLSATKSTKFPGLCVLAILMAIVIPFVQLNFIIALIPQIVFVFILAMFALLLKDHQKLRTERAVMVFFFALFIPLFFSSAIFMRNMFGAAVGGMYLLWALGSAWLSDTGAFFAGRAFGRHKLAPLISPKKTVEGAVGGVVTACLGMLLLGFAYQSVTAAFGAEIHIDYPLLLAVTPLFSAIGILGDLSASVIKRQFGVKDYGSIMPGHGGILDRFDSAMFTIPAVFIVVRHITVVWGVY
ncbi:phosphatidate cytidylyltransferase [Clostridia bacterium]|nr:phosphatidate cytidylyltransferase [Clostridia bacterium]